MSIKIVFAKNDLLTTESFDKLLYSSFPQEKANDVGNTLKKYVFIFDDVLYILDQELIIYRQIRKDFEGIITLLVSSLIEQSYNNFDNAQITIIRDKIDKTKGTSLVTISSKMTILKYYDQIKNMLTKSNVKIDDYIGEIHFKNGYIDIKTNEFKQRTINNYITKYIDRKYIKSKKSKRTQLINILNQIYPIEEDKKSIIDIFGSALTGKSIKDQDMIFLMGQGSAGKSTVLQLTSDALTSTYFIELKSDTFSTTTSEKNKLLNTYMYNPQILLTWINELSNERIDISLFKSFIEGKCSTTALYKEESKNFTHKSKVISTSQTFPNLQIDSGTQRRIKAFTHSSKFTDNKDEVDETKNIYLKNKDLMNDLKDDKKILNAWIDILCESAKRYMNNEPIKYSDNFKDSNDIVIASNDYIQDFIDSILVLTNDDNDRIGKRTMHKKFHEMYHTKHLKEIDIIKCLKEKHITYNKDLRSPDDKVRGCFTGVKFNSDDNDNDVDNNISNEIFDCIEYKGLQDKYRNYILKVFEENNKLKEEIKLLKDKKNEPIKKEEPKIVLKKLFNNDVINLQKKEESIKKEEPKLLNENI